MEIDSILISKYNRPTPRYTSYPPANYFQPSFGSDDLRKAIVKSNQEGIKGLSFYIHVPFCPRLCHYCACNAYEMEKRDNVDAYMQAVLDELEMIIPLLDTSRPIMQIHYGGGTPTAVPLKWLKKINEHLKSSFTLSEGAEIAIECHPAYLSLSGWEELVDAGFTRVSLGVQDFHEDVLAAVNRQPSRVAFEEIFSLLRSHGIGINLDLIYGLPKQTPQSFADNIRRAIALNPDRLVTFSYAHVPWVKSRQLILEKLGLPSAEDKSAMLAAAQSLLKEAGYYSVGMDHFVRPNDALYIAQEQGLLHRNFQGYCTRATTGQVYAVGVTAISQLAGAYAQNTKSIKFYRESIERGELPVERGYKLTQQEQLAGELIASIMCNAQIVWRDFAERYEMSISELKDIIYINRELLQSMAEDNLVVWNEDALTITDKGLPFIRIVASALDPMLAQASGKLPYSMAL